MVDQKKRTCVCCFIPSSKEENQNAKDIQISKWQKNLIGYWVNHNDDGPKKVKTTSTNLVPLPI